MYVGRDFDPQQEDESELFCLDFSRDMQTGDVLASATWEASVSDISDGEDDDAATRIIGAAIFSTSPKTFQRVAGLQPGVTYRLSATVTTEMGDTLTLWSHCEGQR